MDPSLSDQKKQQARTFLRERFLRLMAALNGQQAEISMHGKTNVAGIIRAMDINVQSIQISDLTTPIGVLPEAVLRVSDIRTVSVKDIEKS